MKPQTPHQIKSQAPIQKDNLNAVSPTVGSRGAIRVPTIAVPTLRNILPKNSVVSDLKVGKS